MGRGRRRKVSKNEGEGGSKRRRTSSNSKENEAKEAKEKSSGGEKAAVISKPEAPANSGSVHPLMFLKKYFKNRNRTPMMSFGMGWWDRWTPYKTPDEKLQNFLDVMKSSDLIPIQRYMTSLRCRRCILTNEKESEKENSSDEVKENGSKTSAVSRKRSPNTRTSSTVNSETIKRHLGSSQTTEKEGVDQPNGSTKMETDACATETGGVSISSSSSNSSGYSSSRSNKLNREKSNSAENGKENQIPSTPTLASISKGDTSPLPMIKNRPHRSFVGYMSPYEQFLRFTDSDPKYRSEKSQGKILGLYKFCGEIGSGNFSKVKLGIHQLTKERVAIKIIEKSRVQEKMERMLSREVRSMEVLNHPNLIRLYEVMETGTKIYLISEWAPAGDLYSKVTLRGKLPEYDAKPIFRQILAALLYMHGNGIIHRDLKAENVFFSTGTQCKVGDFGFSTTGYKGQLLSTFCGSPPYAAPELYKDEAYEGGPVDAWALGVLLYFMTEGRLPFIGTSIPHLKRNILNGEYMLSGNLSHELMDLIQKILQQRPSRRLTVHEMIAHPWLLPETCVGTEEFTKNISIESATDSIDECGDSCNSALNSRQTHCSIIRRDTTGKLFPTTKNRAICRGIPTKEQILYKLVSTHEIYAYEILQDIGIPDQMIEAHRSRGVRSYVIGVYRMILHKLEKGDEIDFAKFSMTNVNVSMTNFNDRHNYCESENNHSQNQYQPSPVSAPPAPYVPKEPVKMNSNNSPIRFKDPASDSPDEDEEEKKVESIEEEEDEKSQEEKEVQDMKDMDLNDLDKSQFLSKIENSQPVELLEVANCQPVPQSTTCTIL